MRKLVVMLLALVLVGCTSSIEKVKTSINAYYYYTVRFEEVCPSYEISDCPQYKTEGLLLQSWERYIKESNDAVQRGGQYPLQLKQLKTIEKKLGGTFK